MRKQSGIIGFANPTLLASESVFVMSAHSIIVVAGATSGLTMCGQFICLLVKVGPSVWDLVNWDLAGIPLKFLLIRVR